MFCQKHGIRTFITTTRSLRRPKMIPPKNFSDVHLKGTAMFVQRQLSDPYVKQRRIENYRCRSAFKLLQLDEQHDIMKPGDVVVDLGAAPGSWSQVAIAKVQDGGGLVCAIDLVPISKIEHVQTIVGDFTSEETQLKIKQLISEFSSSTAVDVVLCDAAPRASGVKSMDHDNIVKLVLSAAKFAVRNLKTDGYFLFKLLDGDKTKFLKTNLSRYFHKITSIKPPASRKDSGEFYILCKKL